MSATWLHTLETRFLMWLLNHMYYDVVFVLQRLRAELVDRERIIAELRAQIGAQRVCILSSVLIWWIVLVFGCCGLVLVRIKLNGILESFIFLVNSFLASGDFCHLLLTFENSLYSDQGNPNHLTV